MVTQPTQSKTLNIALWIVQALLAVLFIGTGIFKLIKPVADIAALWPWAGEYPTLLRVTGVLDLCGGIGLVVPALTRIQPQLTVLAAWGCALLLTGAIVFHLSRGEGANTPFNFVLLALVALIIWGRSTRVPVA